MFAILFYEVNIKFEEVEYKLSNYFVEKKLKYLGAVFAAYRHHIWGKKKELKITCLSQSIHYDDELFICSENK